MEARQHGQTHACTPGRVAGVDPDSASLPSHTAPSAPTATPEQACRHVCAGCSVLYCLALRCAALRCMIVCVAHTVMWVCVAGAPLCVHCVRALRSCIAHVCVPAFVHGSIVCLRASIACVHCGVLRCIGCVQGCVCVDACMHAYEL